MRWHREFPSPAHLGSVLDGGGGREFAVLDLTYRQVFGDDAEETEIVSTGESAWAVTEGRAIELTREQTRSLRVAGGTSSPAVPPLDLSAWLVDGEIERNGQSSTVSGEVNASALVADLQEISTQVAGVSGGELDSDTARQIDKSVRRSEMQVKLEGGSLRSVSAVVEFGATVPPGLRKALGQYAGATLELSMSVEDIETPLEVDPPE